MRILAVDTATMSCSVAVVDDGRLKAEITHASGTTHARHLMTMVDMVLDLAGMSVRDVDGFAAVTGPGTFTGLRIGLSSVQGMALAASRPVAGVTSLDVLSAQVAPVAPGHGSLVCALLDARRKEVYYRFYRSHGREAVPMSDHRVGVPAALAEEIKEPCTMVGNGVLQYEAVLMEKLGEHMVKAPSSAHTIRGETVARLAQAAFAENNMSPGGVLQPLYIRKSDAEINASPKTAGKPVGRHVYRKD